MSAALGPISEAVPIDVSTDTNAGQAIYSIFAKLNELIRVLNQAQWEDVEVTTPKANVEFEIHHGLGRTPTGYDVRRRDKACTVYDSGVGSWNKTTMRLKCDAADATVTLRIY